MIEIVKWTCYAQVKPRDMLITNILIY